MGVTLAQYKAALLAHGFDGQDATSLAAAINSARRDVQNAHRWRLLETVLSSSYSLVANTPSLSVPVELDAVRVVDGSDGWDLDYLPAQELETLLTEDPDPDEPENWTQIGTTLYVYPAPNRAYSLRVDSVGTIADLVNDSDADVLPDFTKNAVTYGAACVLAGRQRDYGMAAYWEQKYVVRLNAAIGRDNRTPREGSDQVRLNPRKWDTFNAG